jgi:hypothetical protein
LPIDSLKSPACHPDTLTYGEYVSGLSPTLGFYQGF